MKKNIILGMMIFSLAALIGLSLWGACGTSYLVKVNSAATAGMYTTDSYAAGFNKDLATNPVYAYVWLHLNGTTANSSACGYTGLTKTVGTSPTYVSLNPGFDWYNGCMTGCPGTPPPTDETGRNVVVLWQRLNTGTANHTIRYVLASVKYNAGVGRYQLDDVTNGTSGAHILPNTIGAPYIKDMHKVSGSTWSVTINNPNPAGGGTHGALGFYDTAPAVNLIDSYEIRWQTGSAPTSDDPAAWTTGSTTTANATDDSFTFNITWDGSSTLYFAYRPNFKYGSVWQLPYMGANSVTVGPTASPLFANVTADPTTVSWTSGDESRVASYQAYMSLTANGTYRAIGQPVAALGSGHSYTVNYRVVAPTYYVKIKASKTDGTFVWSSAVKVTRLAPAPKPLPGKAGLRK
jgi:hypothetical protein